MERFYRDAFDLEVLDRNDESVWLAVGDTARLGLWTPGEKEHGDRGGRHVHFAFDAPPGSLDGLAERLGAAAKGPIEHNGGDRSLYVTDPEGNVVEVWDYYRR